MTDAAGRWEEALARWAWPPELLEAASADPWSLGPAELDARRRHAAHRDAPPDVAAREALPRNGTVLDVGCGTGNASVPLRHVASRVTGVDPRPEMLAVFAKRLAHPPGLLRRLMGTLPTVTTVAGRWPAVADEVEPADVVVCHNVLYDVGHDVAAFVGALTDHARRCVVMVLTGRHPLHWINPYAELVHGIQRPAEPTADLAADVVREVTGTTPTVVRWTEYHDPPEDRDAFARLVARRACVPIDRIDEVYAALHRVPPPETTELVAIVWPGAASD